MPSTYVKKPARDDGRLRAPTRDRFRPDGGAMNDFMTVLDALPTDAGLMLPRDVWGSRKSHPGTYIRGWMAYKNPQKRFRVKVSRDPAGWNITRVADVDVENPFA